MKDSVIKIQNLTGIDMDCYPFYGSVEDSSGKEISINGFGITIYKADVEVDEDGCLFIGISDEQAIQFASTLSKLTNNKQKLKTK